MIKSLTKILGGSNERAVRKLRPLVDEINSLESEFETLSNAQLGAKTDYFRSALDEGEDLDDFLPEAFASVREAAKRTLGQRHFDVQLMGGIVLHEGKIAEMKTGEGKTLVATLASYLNALSGRGVHVVTVNDYLARRDAQWMGVIYHILGITVGVLQHDAAYIYDPSGEGERGMENLSPVERIEAYQADITYGTNNEFGFDYLRDNMVVSLSQRVQRPLTYAIVDEVDNILIDEARTPLIISGPSEESAKEYYQFAKLVPNLNQGVDYTIDEKHRAVSLTGDGITMLEKLLNVNNLYDPANFRLVHFAENALKARAIFTRDEEYVVKDGEVVIVDEFTGRMMSGRRYSDGIHQALEAKEGLKVQRETITYATITLQNYFRLYSKLAGMTGTAATEAEEFFKIYKVEVVEVPANLPMIREDSTDLIYKDNKAKYNAVVNEFEVAHHRGQPVLVGTTDISKSEHLSGLLTRKGIPHQVLNAKLHEREANIVAEAGRSGAVTVATNMAGRGTDIVLGGSPDSEDITLEQQAANRKKVVDLGGLYIIGTERHEARRIDNQLRGRAGRQGDPGITRFFVALDDDLMKRFGGERIQTVMNWAGLDEDDALENRMVSKTIESAQVKVEAYHFDMRKHLVEYDDVVNTHRSVIYGDREKILEGADLRANVMSMVERELIQTTARYMENDSIPDNRDVDGLLSELESILPLIVGLSDPNHLAQIDREEVESEVIAAAVELYREREESLGLEVMRQVEREVMLRITDAHWVPHITRMENLRQGIGLYAYGQRDPLVMYKKEGHQAFEELQSRIQYAIVHTIYNVRAEYQGGSNGRNRRAATRGHDNGKDMKIRPTESQSKEPAFVGSRKVGRNEPCPCGSGNKYKRCHGA